MKLLLLVLSPLSLCEPLLLFLSVSDRRKSKQALRDYKKVQIQLENLETSVRDRCKKEFTGKRAQEEQSYMREEKAGKRGRRLGEEMEKQESLFYFEEANRSTLFLDRAHEMILLHHTSWMKCSSHPTCLLLRNEFNFSLPSLSSVNIYQLLPPKSVPSMHFEYNI